MIKSIRIYFGLMLVLVLCQPLSAQEDQGLPFGPIISEQALTSFTIVGTGARAIGMGSAFTALADDATAASFNPAGLAQITTPEVSFVGQQSTLTDNYIDFLSFDQTEPLPLTDSSINSDSATFNFFSITLPFSYLNHRWSAQVSTHEIVNLDYSGDRTLLETDHSGVPLFDLQQSVSNSGHIGLYSGSLSLQATSRTLLGLTINRWDGNWQYFGKFSENPVGAPELTESFAYSQQNSLKGWNFDAGILLKYEHFNVGFRYRSPSDLDYFLSAEVATVGVVTERQPVEPTRTTLRWPASYTLGWSWKPTDTFVLSCDVGHTNWSKMNFEFNDLGERNFFDLALSKETSASTAEDIHVGGEYIFVGKWGVMPLRAGWARVPQPAIDPVTGERLVTSTVAGGLGFKKNWFSIDLAYAVNQSSTQISRFIEPDDIADGAYAANSSGRLDRTDQTFTLSFIIQFSKGSPFRRLLNNIFVGPG